MEISRRRGGKMTRKQTRNVVLSSPFCSFVAKQSWAGKSAYLQVVPR